MSSRKLFIIGTVIFLTATLFILFLPYWVTNYSLFPISVKEPNEIGDTIGGIMGPAAGLLAAYLTFLAFWAQYNANVQVQNQFKLQQFESQFYEMLRMHKTNVDDVIIYSIEDDKEYKNKNAFKLMVNEFNYMLTCFDLLNIKINKENYLDAYNYFFTGNNKLKENNFLEVLNQIEKITSDPKKINRLIFRKHNGYSFVLAHYFRHLYLTVKYIVNSDVIDSYEKKMSYLKILRAQLSNYEQVLIFYNWLAKPFGGAWEEDSPEGNCYLTDYKMIHNLWVTELKQDDYIVSNVNYLIEKYNLKNKKVNRTPLFSFQENDFDFKYTVTKPTQEDFV
jgi:hypothetical protein